MTEDLEIQVLRHLGPQLRSGPRNQGSQVEILVGPETIGELVQLGEDQ